MPQTAAHRVDPVVPDVPVRQWVLSLPNPLQVAQRRVTRHLLAAAGLTADGGHGGAVMRIQRLGSAARLKVQLHCLVPDGVYRCVGKEKGV